MEFRINFSRKGDDYMSEKAGVSCGFKESKGNLLSFCWNLKQLFTHKIWVDFMQTFDVIQMTTTSAVPGKDMENWEG